MKFYELDLNGEIIKLRLTTSDCKVLEKKTGMSILEFVQNFSITSISTILMYMRRSDVQNFSEAQADELLDKLIDNGYALEDIVKDVIMQGLVVSGFLKKTDLMEITNKATDKKQVQE